MTYSFKLDPADDLGMPAGAAMRSVVREPGLAGCLCTRACWMFVSRYLRWRFALTVEGGERLPAEGPFVMVANHASHLDALVLGASVPRRLRHATFPIAAGDVFFATPTRAAMATLSINALPMWRKNAGRHALEQLRRRVTQRRGVFVLFPEGTRSRDGAMGRFKDGVGMLVAGTDTPVFPAHIAGAHEVWPPDAKRPARGRREPITVRIGEAMRFPGVANKREGWRAIAQELEDAVRSLAAD